MVSCLTYNQAPYIRDALNGFTMQQTDFPYVCVIIDDASTDGEQEVILKYLNENFDLYNKTITYKEETDNYVLIYSKHKNNHNCLFAVFFLKYNHYSISKGKDAYYSKWSNTKYIAFCEGDDYWTNPEHLQRQVDYLENNPEYGLVCANCRLYNENTQSFDKSTSGKGLIFFEDLLLSNVISTFTVAIRRIIWNNYQKEIGVHKNWLMGDYPLWLYTTKISKAYKFGNIIGVYRKRKGSASHPVRFQDSVDFCNCEYDIQMFFINNSDMKDNGISSKIDELHQYALFVKAFKFKKYDEAIKLFHCLERKNIKCIIAYLICIIKTSL